VVAGEQKAGRSLNPGGPDDGARAAENRGGAAHGQLGCGNATAKTAHRDARRVRGGLQAHPQAEATFNALPPSQQKPYLTWILTAKRPETRAKRIAESMQLLSEGKALGLRG
jgi:hypothetical protein